METEGSHDEKKPIKNKNAQESWKEMFNRGNFVAVKHEGGNGQLPYCPL